MGAVIPRYNLEALLVVNISFSFWRRMEIAIPLVLDDFPEAIDHAIVTLFTSSLSSLKLPV
jgi:hypothetical protein